MTTRSLIPGLLLVALLFCAGASAQEAYYGPYAFKAGTEQVIWADSANLREKPDMWSRPVAIIPVGTSVKIVRQEAALLTAGKKTAPWYKVTVAEGGTLQTGFIWGGLLSLKPLAAGDTRFLFGYENTPRFTASRYDSTATDTTARLTVVVKAVRNNAIVDRTSYNISEEAINGISGSVERGKKLPGTKSIVRISFAGEACGIPTYTHDFAWSGTALKPLPPLMSVSDAGVFYHEEEAVYPGDKGGQAGMIIHRIKEGEFDEKKDDYVDKKPVTEVYVSDTASGYYRKK